MKCTWDELDAPVTKLRSLDGYSRLSVILLAYLAFTTLGMRNGLLGVLPRQYSVVVIAGLAIAVFLGWSKSYLFSTKIRHQEITA
jgi:hypothetical protein